MLKKSIHLPISNFSEILGVHQRTLRIWDDKGILVPKRTEGNRRYYTIEDISKGEFILFLTRNLLLNITGVKIILGLLQESNIEIKDYINYTNKIAQTVNIDEKSQNENILKNSRRGRKKKAYSPSLRAP